MISCVRGTGLTGHRPTVSRRLTCPVFLCLDSGLSVLPELDLCTQNKKRTHIPCLGVFCTSNSIRVLNLAHMSENATLTMLRSHLATHTIKLFLSDPIVSHKILCN